MTLTQITCHTLDCDECGKPFEGDEGVFHFSDFDEAIKVLRYDQYGWCTDGRVVLCDDCTGKPHAFVLSPETGYDCWRCDEPADEHPTPDELQPIPVADGQLAIDVQHGG